MDVKALYPSLQWGPSAKNCQQAVKEADVTLAEVDSKAIGRYMAVTMTKKERKPENIRKFIPKTKSNVHCTAC